MSRLEGTTPLRGVIGDIVSNLGRRIVAGEWAANQTITKEPELIKELRASRSVLREALRVLAAKGLIESKTSVGTTVRNRSAWRLLDPDVISWRIAAGEQETLLSDLLRLRLVMEPGVAELAARSSSDAARARIADAWRAKVTVFEASDMPDPLRRDAFIKTDLDFHRALIVATDSEMLGQLFSIIEAALGLLLDLQMQARGYKSKMIGMDHSHELHEAVFNAVMARDPALARSSMQTLLETALQDAVDGFTLLKGAP